MYYHLVKKICKNSRLELRNANESNCKIIYTLPNMYKCVTRYFVDTIQVNECSLKDICMIDYTWFGDL